MLLRPDLSIERGVSGQRGWFRAVLSDPVYVRRGGRRRVARYKPVDEFVLNNAAVTDGFNALLGYGFKGVAQVTTWYLGLIDNSGYSSIPATDTMASHAGWTEFQTYSQATRPAWTPGTAAAGSLASSAATVFSITANATLRGAFLTSVSTKGGTTGILWCTAVEAGGRAVSNGQSLQVFYTNTFTPVS